MKAEGGSKRKGTKGERDRGIEWRARSRTIQNSEIRNQNAELPEEVLQWSSGPVVEWREREKGKEGERERVAERTAEKLDVR